MHIYIDNPVDRIDARQLVRDDSPTEYVIELTMTDRSWLTFRVRSKEDLTKLAKAFNLAVDSLDCVNSIGVAVPHEEAGS